MLSQILVDYIVFVRPFAAIIASHVLGEDAMHQYLYRIFTCLGEPFSTDDFSSSLSSVTKPPPSEGGIGMPLGISHWRQLSTAICHSEVFYPLVKHLSVSSESDLIPDLQAGHSSRVASGHYGRVSGRMAFADIRRMSMYLEFSTHYIHLMNLEREVPESVRDPSVSIGLDSAGNSSSPLSSHASTLSSSSLPVDCVDADAMVTKVISSLTPIILNSARESAAQSAAVLKKALSPPKICSVDESTNDISVPFEILCVLRLLMKDDTAQFKSREQALAVMWSLRKQGNLLTVLPTGGGKSLVFLLPLLYDRLNMCRGVNMLIVPYNVLKEDMRQRCLQLGLTAAIFDPHMTVDEALAMDCIICVADSVDDDRLHVLLRTLEQLGHLSRVFVDEVHHVHSSNMFRETFNLLYRLRLYAVPLILLSATMPPAYVDPLMQSLSISSLKVIRSPTWRPELYMAVTWLPDEDPAGFFLFSVNEYQTLFPGEKILIFCQTKSQVDDVWKLIPGSLRYHSGLSHEDLERSMMSFTTGQSSSSIMVSTSMLGNGLNIPYLRVVLHYGAPYSMTDYVQQSGRAARDGSFGASHIFVHGPENDNPCQHDGASVGVEEIRSWLSKAQPCRRSLLHEVIDGSAVTCSSIPNAVLCDICFRAKSEANLKYHGSSDGQSHLSAPLVPEVPAPAPFPPQVQDHILPLAAPNMDVLVDQRLHFLTVDGIENDRQNLQNILATIKAGKMCIACWSKGQHTSAHTQAFKCINPNFFSPLSGFIAFREMIRLPRGYCFFCGISQVGMISLAERSS